MEWALAPTTCASRRALPGSSPVGGAWRAVSARLERTSHTSTAGKFRRWWACTGMTAVLSERHENAREEVSSGRNGGGHYLGFDGGREGYGDVDHAVSSWSAELDSE